MKKIQTIKVCKGINISFKLFILHIKNVFGFSFVLTMSHNLIKISPFILVSVVFLSLAIKQTESEMKRLILIRSYVSLSNDCFKMHEVRTI